MSIKELRNAIAAAQKEYLEADAKARDVQDDLKAKSDKVKEARKALNDFIIAGAKPCPKCGAQPIGIEHQVRGGVTYEVGCPVCKPFVEPTGDKDGDGRPLHITRYPSARGGILPRHAVEAWNEGPSFWQTRGEPFVVEEEES